MIELRLLGPAGITGVDASVADAVLRQPRRLALLAYLAIATRDGFERRDRVLAMFWPEQSAKRARHALRQALHGLRATLGRDLIANRGDDEIAVNATALRCDAAEAERLLDAGRREEALALARGELLPGFFVSGAPEFERWLESTRDRFRSRSAAAAASLTSDAEARDDLADAVRWTRRAQELSPTDEAVLRRLITLLDRAGDRAGALHAHQQFERRLALDLEAEPAPATQALARELRGAIPGRDRAVGISPGRELVPSEPVPARPVPSAEAPHVRRLGRYVALAVAGAVIVSVIALGFALGRPQAPASAFSALPVPSRTTLARRLYDEGRSAWTHQDYPAAERLMRAAIREDSTFGLAMLHLGHVIGLQGRHAEGQRLQERATRLAPTQSDHDRLVILAWYAENFSEPSRRFYAETLAIRYPDDFEGQLFVAHARYSAGDFLGTVAPLRRVLARESAYGEDDGSYCLACRAYRDLVDAYENADSLAAAERAAREWIRARPRDAEAWNTLAYELAIQDRYEEALAARRRSDDLRGVSADPLAVGEILLRAGDFRTLDHIVSSTIENGSLEQASNARFIQWQMLREQGRMREALGVSRAMDALVAREPGLDGIAMIMRAQSFHENGRFAESARLWDSSAAHVLKENSPASAARSRVVRLMHMADAVAGLGDTSTLARLADSIRADGARSGFARDHRLHHHVRGLRLQLVGRASEACDAFRAALFTASAAYIRTNLALGRACLDAGRAADATTPLRGVLHGPTGAAGTYGTHIEARELLARAFVALGQRDSARAHYARVAAAWRSADPPFRARGDSARSELARLGGAAATGDRARLTAARSPARGR